MNLLLPLLALGALAAFLAPLLAYVPSPDLIAVAIFAFALACWDFIASMRRGDDGR